MDAQFGVLLCHLRMKVVEFAFVLLVGVVGFVEVNIWMGLLNRLGFLRFFALYLGMPCSLLPSCLQSEGSQSKRLLVFLLCLVCDDTQV